MKEYIEIIRPSIVFLSALGVMVGAIASKATILNLVLAIASVVLISSAGIVTNDYYDYEIDKINTPHRPLPSGRISKKFAKIYAIFLFIGGTVIASFINIYCFALAIINSFLEFFYARNLKRIALVGNATDSWFVASTFLYGYLASLGKEFIIADNFYLILIFSLLSFFANIGREIFGDIEDLNGDKMLGLKTLPIITSVKFSRFIASLFIILSVILSPLPFLLGFFSYEYIVIVLIADLLFIYSIFQEPKKNQKITKIAMLVAIIAFLAGILL
ncbi:MAG: UbiA family prenyltransferase [Candidatus Aenigmatarchaeota archaeon]